MNPEIQDVLRAQNRRRRTIFWAGFFAILIVGGLWAGLSKDPLDPAFFGIALVGPSAKRLTAVSTKRLTAVAASMAAAVMAVTAALAMFAGPVAAETTDEEESSDEFAEVELKTLGNVPWEEGRRVNASVTVATNRAVSGTLLVTNTPNGQSTTTYEYDIDLAAGSTATFPLTLTTGWNGIDATAVLRSSGDTVASDDLVLDGAGGGEDPIVAVLGIDDPPIRVPEIGGDDRLVTFEIDGALRGLETASTLVAQPQAIAELEADTERFHRLQGWILGGGQLVVEGPTQSLDGRFHGFPTANPDRFSYGAGSVVYAEDWRDGVPLGGYLGTAGMRDLVNSQGLGAGSSGELGLLAGISLPSVTVIALVLLAYTVIAGPVLFGVVAASNMQRRIWVALPALSLLFVAGIVGFGFIGRSGTDDVHVTIVEVNDQGSRATTNLLLTSSIGGNRSVDVPDEWAYLGQARTEGQRPVRLRVGSSDTEVSFEIPPGGNATARALGSAPQYDGLLSIDNIRIDGDELVADVSNNGTADLSEVLVFNGNTRAKVEDLPAGQTITVSVPAADESTRTMQELLLWPRVEQRWTNSGQVAVPVDDDAETAAGAWTEWRVEQGSSSAPENVLGVVGWTDDLAAPIGGVTVGRTALFARSNIPADIGDVGFSTTIRLPSRQAEPEFFDDFGGYPQDFLVTLQPGADPTALAVNITRDSAALAFWIDDTWQYVTLPNDNAATVAVPAEAVVDGQVRFRSFEADWAWGVGLTALVVTDEDAATFPLSTDARLRGVDGRGFDERFPVEEGVMIDEESFDRPLLTEYEVVPDADGVYEVDTELIDFGYDAYFVELAQDQSLTVLMSSLNHDPFMELYSPDGEFLLGVDDSNGTLDAEFTYTASTAGIHEIRALGRDPVTGYLMRIEVIE